MAMGFNKRTYRKDDGVSSGIPSSLRVSAGSDERTRGLKAVILIVLLAFALCLLSFYLLQIRAAKLVNTSGPDFKVSTLLTETGPNALTVLSDAGFTYIKGDDANGFFYLPLGLSDEEQRSEWLASLDMSNLSDEDREMLGTIGIIECYDIDGNMLSEEDLKDGAQIVEATISYFGTQELAEGIGDNTASRTLFYQVAEKMGVTVLPSTLSYREGGIAAYDDMSIDVTGNDTSWYLTISTLSEEDPLLYEVSFGINEVSS